MTPAKPCSKCGSTDFGLWTSSTTGKLHSYCRSCRRGRAKTYGARKGANGGHHNQLQWLCKLQSYERCPGCQRRWDEIPPRPDRRYRHKWTKDHVVPVSHGGSDDIENIQPLCWHCNFEKLAKLNWSTRAGS